MDNNLSAIQDRLRETFNISDKKKEEEQAPPQFVDIYQRDASAALEESKKRRPNGSSARVNAIADKIINGDGGMGLTCAYKRAKDTVDELKKSGFRNRADIAKNQYMEERFIPAVETIIRYSSPDELLNCRDVLSKLDKLALGVGAMPGYTASYVRQAYGDLLGKDLDNRFNTSDPVVTDAVRRIRVLSSMDKIRTAVGVAEQIKRKIENGQQIANDDDYALIVRVANF